MPAIARVRRFCFPYAPRNCWKNLEMMQLLLPRLRADFAVDSNYRYRSDPGLAGPILVLGGTEDPEVDRAALAAGRRKSGSRGLS